MMHLRATLAIGALTAVVACASGGSGGQPSYQQEHVSVDSPEGRYDILLTREAYLSSDTLTIAPKRAWPALVQTYAAFGVPLQGADPVSRMIATNWVRAHSTFAGERLSRWLDCGASITGDIATMYEITLRFGTVIDTSVAGRSIIRTALSATAVAPGSGTTPVNCNTRGAFEKRIASLVLSKATQ